MKRLLALVAVVAVSACAGSPPPTVSAPAADTAAIVQRQLDVAANALEEGRMEEAAQLYARVLSQDAHNVHARLGVAELKLARGDSREAKRMFDELDGIDEVAARAHQGKGLAALRMNRKHGAERELAAAVESDPTLWRAWNALGHLHDAAGRWEQAGDAYGKALEHAPDRAPILNNLGFSLMLQQKWGEAVRPLTEAVKLQPDFQLARNNLRLALAWQGRYVEALAGVPRDEMPAALNNVGYAAMMRGEYATAEGYLTRAVETSTYYFEPAAMNLLRLDALRDLKKVEDTRK